MSKRFTFLRALVAGVTGMSVAAPLHGELNVPVAARVVSFVQPAPGGTVPAAIVFQPGNPASEADAAAIERAVGDGMAAGRGSIRARRVAVSAMGTLAGYRVAFVTAGLRAAQPEIASAAARFSVLTISSDPLCVRTARCVVGISTTPKVQITVNRAAARASNIRFGSAFLMLVKEI